MLEFQLFAFFMELYIKISVKYIFFKLNVVLWSKKTQMLAYTVLKALRTCSLNTSNFDYCQN